jgi:hypothetical protein
MSRKEITMQSLDIERRMRQFRHATVARSALDVIALIFLCCGFAFWSVAFWQLLSPPALLSLLSIQVAVLGLVYSLATPLLWSALVPSTPAGQLLQKTQWRTFGFAAIVGAAFFLTYQAEKMIELWLFAQPGIQEAGFARGLAISLAIGFILIPALAWTQLTPERWLAQIQQAHQVKKLEMQQRGELAIIKASLLRAKSLAAIGWANLLPQEKDEVFNTLRGLLMASSDTMRNVVYTLDMSSELERTIMDDEAIAAELAFVAKAIDIVPALAPAAALPDAASPPEPPKPIAAPVIARVRPAQDSAAQRDDAYTVAFTAFGRDQAWTVRDLATVLSTAESTARTQKQAWEAAGRISSEGLAKGRHRFI